jgi:hypothetical protein
MAVGSRRIPIGASSEEILATLSWNRPGRGASAVAGTVGLELDDVQHQLVRPGDLPHLDLGDDLAGLRLEQPIGGGTHVERLGVDQHVLELDAEPREQRQPSRAHGGPFRP